MREIRYRAWDKTSNLMRTDITSIEFKSDGSLAQINVISGADILYPEKEAVLMQYTGLKDRNGVDIFEGDIIKYAYRDYTVVVKPLERGRYSAFWDFSDFLDPSDNELGAEVIGNIYEHGHLLENESKE